MERRQRIIWSVVGVVALGFMFWQFGGPMIPKGTPQKAAESYLDLLAEGDYSEILEYVEDTVDLDEASDVYLAEDIRDYDLRYEINRDGIEDHGDWATVSYWIEDYAGERFYGSFRLERSGMTWKIINPLAEISVSDAEVAYGDVNGVVTDEPEFWLLPGAYSFYSSHSEYLEPEEELSFVTTHGDGLAPYEPQNFPEDYYSITSDDANPEVEDVEFNFDECESITDASETNCPINLDIFSERTLRVEDQTLYSEEIDEISWDITEEPELSAVGETGLGLTVVSDGAATVAVTDIDNQDFVADCDFWAVRSQVVLVAPDEVSIDIDQYELLCGSLQAQ